MAERDEEAEIKDVSFNRPHVVILGAGASCAALPNGDRNGKKLPTMATFVDVLGLNELLENHGIEYEGRNFEEVYSELKTSGAQPALIADVEHIVFNYFADMQLPDHPTIYDYLILSLRKKDMIATFNWDPFLVQAYERNKHLGDAPDPVFLHGNVGIAYCDKHDKILVSPRGYFCRTCQTLMQDSVLLYPVKEKGYSSDRLIATGWADLSTCLKRAYILTIFGYSAPASDVEAKSLMKKAWGRVGDRNLEEIEIIDLKDEDVLGETWKDFIHSHHYRTYTDFYDSFLARHPRRSCESMWAQLMECQFLTDREVPRAVDFPTLWNWHSPLMEVEREDGCTGRNR